MINIQCSNSWSNLRKPKPSFFKNVILNNIWCFGIFRSLFKWLLHSGKPWGSRPDHPAAAWRTLSTTAHSVAKEARVKNGYSRAYHCTSLRAATNMETERWSIARQFAVYATIVEQHGEWPPVMMMMPEHFYTLGNVHCLLRE